MPRSKRNKQIVEPKNPLVKVGAINFNVLGYGNPNIKQQHSINKITGYSHIFDKLKDVPFPKNDSSESMKEMKFIQSQWTQMKNENTRKECLAIDKDLKSYLSSICNKLEINGFEEFFDKLNDDFLETLIFKLKFHYNRMRPFQLSWYFIDEIDIVPILSYSALSPSYPSGHTLQGIVVTKVLSTHFPQHKQILDEVALRIAMSRIIVGVHYPSDNAFSEQISKTILSDEKFQKNFIDVKWDYLIQAGQ
jgi:hypothetical protein